MTTIPISFPDVAYSKDPRRQYLQWHNWKAHIGQECVWIDIPRSMKDEAFNQVQTSWQETWKCRRRR